MCRVSDVLGVCVCGRLLRRPGWIQNPMLTGDWSPELRVDAKSLLPTECSGEGGPRGHRGVFVDTGVGAAPTGLAWAF